MRRFWKGVLLCWSLAAGLGGLACGTTWRGEPGDTGEASDSGAGRAGASSSGSGGAQAQGGTAGTAGRPVILLDPLGGVAGGTGEPEEVLPTPHAATPCDDPQPFPLGGGYLVCEDQSLRLSEPSACPSVLPRDKPTDPLFFEDCALDTDCVESAHGFCAYGQCKYGCVSDDECGDGLCFCGAEIGKCVSASCHSDADCPPDYPCTGNAPFGTDSASFRCQTPLDTCASDYDCPGPRMHCQVVGFDENGRRACVRDPIG